MIKKFYLVVLFVCNGLLNNFFLVLKKEHSTESLLWVSIFPPSKKWVGHDPHANEGPGLNFGLQSWVCAFELSSFAGSMVRALDYIQDAQMA